jgi:carbamoyltransferase
VIVLGFTYWNGSHDSSAAIVQDGMLLAAAELERFTRNKHDGGVPFDAIDYCLREAGVRMQDVDAIAYPDLPFRTGPNSQLAETSPQSVADIVKAGRMRRRTMAHKHALSIALKLGIARDAGMNPLVADAFHLLEKRYGTLPPVRFYGHHLSHAAAAYLTSGLDDAAVATLDGRGGALSSATWHAHDVQIARLEDEPYSNSLGWFYRDCTRYAGLGDFGEGKLMGLAPYGDARGQLAAVNQLIDTVDARWFRYKRPPRDAGIGFGARAHDELLEGPWRDFAAAAQHALERGYERAVRSAIGASRSRNLCVGGGVAMNCSANGKLLASGIADRMWLFPASGDAGLSVGAALLASRDMGAATHARIDSPYWGPAFTDDECEKVLNATSGVSFTRAQDLSNEVAAVLARGDVVGWFQGRMELGPRALGNRSILADPRSVAMRDKANRVKRREQWRPLAPSILAERTGEWFEMVPPNSFMLFAVQARPITRERAPAIVHVDGSARPQPVSRALNPRYYDLIGAFERTTGVPILLNTSFNDAGEPIVCTPADAVRTFLATDLDALVLGPFIARKNP